RRGNKTGPALRNAEGCLYPRAAEIDIFGCAPQATPGLHFDAEFLSDFSKRLAIGQLLAQLLGARGEACRGLLFFPVGGDAVAYFVQAAVAGGRDVLDLVKEEAGRAYLDRRVLKTNIRLECFA